MADLSAAELFDAEVSDDAAATCAAELENRSLKASVSSSDCCSLRRKVTISS